jgi:hypothetical protein
MRLRRAATIPAIAAVTLSGAVAFGGCGGDSNAATNGSTTESMHHEAMKHDGGAMKHEGDSMKDQGKAMKDQDKAMQHEGSSDDHMEG